jgi:hypothetical protein
MTEKHYYYEITVCYEYVQDSWCCFETEGRGGGCIYVKKSVPFVYQKDFYKRLKASINEIFPNTKVYIVSWTSVIMREEDYDAILQGLYVTK